MPKIEFSRALVLSAKRYNDTAFVLNVFSHDNGRYLGIFKGKNPPQSGTFVMGRWQARLAEQFGNLYIEPLNSFAIQFLDDKKRLAVISSVCYLIEKTVPERQAYAELFNQTDLLFTHLHGADFLKNYAHWEMDLLAALGFGLDFSTCAGACGSGDFAYISPKTGRAVCENCGRIYKSKLLALPVFLYREAQASDADIRAALNLTGYFLERHFGFTLPPARQRLL